MLETIIALSIMGVIYVSCLGWAVGAIIYNHWYYRR